MPFLISSHERYNRQGVHHTQHTQSHTVQPEYKVWGPILGIKVLKLSPPFTTIKSSLPSSAFHVSCFTLSCHVPFFMASNPAFLSFHFSFCHEKKCRSCERNKERTRIEGGKEGEKVKKAARIMNQKLSSIDQSLLTTTAYAI